MAILNLREGSETMIIRPATPPDHPSLAELFLAARKQAFPWLPAGSLSLDDFADQTKGEAIHLAEDADRSVLGFISVWEEEDFVHHLFVAPGHQRMGTGRALLLNLASRRAGPFTLKCHAANLAAVSFYRATGWREIGSGSTAEGGYLLMEWRPPGNLAPLLRRRPAEAADFGFLWELHLLTMQDYAARTWGPEKIWDEPRFREKSDLSGLEILEIDGVLIGMISVSEEPESVFLRRIAIHPEWQNRGIGSMLVEQVICDTREKGLPTTLQVLKVNPALHFYGRRGFRVTGETETHFLMEHSAGA